MLEHTKKHLTKKILIFCLSEQGSVFNLPQSVAHSLAKYEAHDPKTIEKVKNRIKKTLGVEPEPAFAKINEKYSKAGALLKAVRLREGLNQKQFAAAIQITQGDLSKMENGSRSIGKNIAKRIARQFNVDPNLLIRI